MKAAHDENYWDRGECVALLREAADALADVQRRFDAYEAVIADRVWDSARKADAISLLREQQRTCAELIPGEVVLIEVSRVLNALGEMVQP